MKNKMAAVDMGTATVICEPSPYPALSQLIKQGKRESTADIYKRSLLNMYNKLDEDVGMSYPFEDVRWLTDKDPILTYLQNIKPSIASARMSAIRGTLKGVSNLYAYWEDESGAMIEKPPDEPTQSYTPREEKNFASVKVMLDKMHTYDDAIRDMLRRRRQCRAQNGFDATPMVLTLKDRKTLLRWLTLSLYAQTAPVRNDMADMPFVERSGNPFDTPDNYITCTDPSKRPYPEYQVVLGYHKSSDKHGTVIRDMPRSVNQHIYESLKIWPRKYLIPLLKDGSKPMGRSGFSHFFTKIFDDKSVGSRMARKAWKTKLDGKERTAEEKAKTAKDMLHTPAIADRYYLKFKA